jgi:hypothetical protein
MKKLRNVLLLSAISGLSIGALAVTSFPFLAQNVFLLAGVSALGGIPGLALLLYYQLQEENTK